MGLLFASLRNHTGSVIAVWHYPLFYKIMVHFYQVSELWPMGLLAGLYNHTGGVIALWH